LNEPPSQQAALTEAPTLPEDDRRYIHIRRSHFYAALLPIVFAAGLAYGYLLWGRAAVQTDPSASSLGGFSAAGRIEVDPGEDPSIGPPDAPVTVIEFSDYNCPFCQQWQREVFDELMAAFPAQIRFVYKDFPIVGEGTPGFGAAEAANSAAEQGAYWEFHQALFSGDYPLDRAGFEAITRQLELDLPAIQECLDSGRQAAEVDEDFRYGADLGVNGTPTFFINGIPLIGAQPLLRFVEVINAELGR
jgi:predicted DsbA family dithiol-disulfide isomerase